MVDTSYVVAGYSSEVQIIWRRKGASLGKYGPESDENVTHAEYLERRETKKGWAVGSVLWRLQ